MKKKFKATFVDRVLAEHRQLEERYDKLIVFKCGEIFEGLPIEDQNLLDRQEDLMREYLNVLQQRIERFK